MKNGMAQEKKHTTENNVTLHLTLFFSVHKFAFSVVFFRPYRTRAGCLLALHALFAVALDARPLLYLRHGVFSWLQCALNY